MPLPQNPDEYFSKPLNAMTTPTIQTPPEPPAAGELSDEQLLQIAEKELGIDDAMEAHQDGYPIEVTTIDLIIYGRAAISADCAQRHPQAEQMAEALRRLWRWGGFRSGWDAKVAYPLGRWIDSGMVGPLPPLPEYIARQGEQPPTDETTTTTEN